MNAGSKREQPVTKGSWDRGRTASYIRALIPSLVPSEARVAEALLGHGGELAHLSVADLAQEAEASAATVVRACQSFGFSGFSELRDELRREAETPGDEHPDSANGARSALERTIRAGIAQLESMSAMLDRDAFERAVDALASARRVLVVTLSDLAVLGQYAVLHFAMVGRAAEAPTDVITLHAVASLLEPGDVCLAVGYSGTNALTIRIVQSAAATGATVIAITSFARGALVDLADIHLAVGVPGAEASTDTLRRIRVGQMLMIDALQTALSHRLDTRRPTEALLRTITHYTYRRPRAEPGPESTVGT